MLRVNWDIEELVAIIDLCVNREGKKTETISEELEELSSALNIRADKLGIPHDDKFRNLNGMKMTYQNVLFVISKGEIGLSGANKMISEVYRLYIENPKVFFAILDQFNRYYRLRE